MPCSTLHAPRLAVLARQYHAKHLDRQLDIFQLCRAKPDQFLIQLVLHLFPDGAGDANASWFGQRLDARRDVDAISIDIPLAAHDVSKMDSNADADLA